MSLLCETLTYFSKNKSNKLYFMYFSVFFQEGVAHVKSTATDSLWKPHLSKLTVFKGTYSSRDTGKPQVKVEAHKIPHLKNFTNGNLDFQWVSCGSVIFHVRHPLRKRTIYYIKQALFDFFWHYCTCNTAPQAYLQIYYVHRLGH